MKKNIFLLFSLGFVIFSLSLITMKVVAADHIRKALADVNRDGVISQKDLNHIQKAYGKVNPTGKKALSDVNQDGIVDILDLSFVGARDGKKVSVCELADINNDKKVDQNDLNVISASYGQTDTSANMPADLNGDGLIDVLDLSKAGAVYGCTW